MNFKPLFYTLFVFALLIKNVFSDEIKINSSKIKVSENGNLISALNVKANIPEKKIDIEGDKSIYDKKKVN